MSAGVNQIWTISEPRANEKKKILFSVFFTKYAQRHSAHPRTHTHTHTHITLKVNQCRIFLSVTADYQHWRHMQFLRL